MTRKEMQKRGHRVAQYAYPDYGDGDRREQVVDTITDLLHYADSLGIDARGCARSALEVHFEAEVDQPVDEDTMP